MKQKQEKVLIKTIAIIILTFALIIVYVSVDGNNVYAKTKEIYTCLMQKNNSSYEEYKKNGVAVSHKVNLKSNKIVIYGSLRNTKTLKTTKIRKHVYKLSDNVKYILRSGEDPDVMYSKKNFKMYLEKCKDLSLALVLEFKRGKVIKVIISS